VPTLSVLLSKVLLIMSSELPISPAARRIDTTLGED
jgi:hypothetical protein